MLHKEFDKESAMAPTEIIYGDMFKCDWQMDADIVYMSNLCFPDEMNDRIAVECEKARSGTKIIALKSFKEDIVATYLRLEAVYEINMTWGNHETKIYIRV